MKKSALIAAILLFHLSAVVAGSESESTGVDAVDESMAPSEEEKQAIEESIRALTETYFENQEKQDYKKSYAMLSDRMQADSSFEKWKAEREEFRKMSGPRTRKEVWRATLHIDPPSTSKPGIYVAVDYEASYENLPLKCGYVVWFRKPDGDFRVIREESGYLEKNIISRLSRPELEQIKKQYGCKVP